MVLNASSARSLTQSIEIDVMRRRDDRLMERVTILRYAGHYRSSAIDGFAVKDAEGKFHVRSAKDLGLTEESEFEARVVNPGVIDIRDGQSDVA